MFIVFVVLFYYYCVCRRTESSNQCVACVSGLSIFLTSIYIYTYMKRRFGVGVSFSV
jgi:hypothetical protein